MLGEKVGAAVESVECLRELKRLVENWEDVLEGNSGGEVTVTEASCAQDLGLTGWLKDEDVDGGGCNCRRK